MKIRQITLNCVKSPPTVPGCLSYGTFEASEPFPVAA